MKRRGARISYHDPYIPSFNYLGREWHSQPLDTATLQKQDCVIIVTDHSCFNYEAIIGDSNLIFDTRNATRRARNGHTNIEVL